MSARTIEFGGLTFSDVLGPGWGFSDFIDWFGTTPDKAPVNERAQGHGAQPVDRSLRSSKALTLRVNYIGQNGDEVERAFDELTAVAAEGPVLLRANYPTGSTWRWVTADVTVDDHFGYPVGHASIQMIARDPLRYADAEFVEVDPPGAGTGPVSPLVWPLVWTGGAPGRVSLANTGRAPSPPDFRLRGGFDSATIVSLSTGNRIGFNRPVPAGDFVLIETRNRRALYNGTSDVSRWLQWREWERIPARTTRDYSVEMVNPVGSPKLGGRVYPAWW